LDGVTLVDLYADYPTYEIDVEREQERLLAHDVVVLQHPVYWYSAPALLKEWIDLVLEWRWAYGPGGDALRGKIWLNAVTAGGARAAYTPEGRNRLDLRALFSPFEQTAMLCGMTYLPPFALFDANDRRDRAVLDSHAASYAKMLRDVREGALDMDEAVELRGLAEMYPRRIKKD
jgi:putative NADPH-quinone reductase